MIFDEKKICKTFFSDYIGHSHVFINVCRFTIFAFKYARSFYITLKIILSIKSGYINLRQPHFLGKA